MINHSLQLFCNRVVAASRISAADVVILGRDILPDGISHADEADMLRALLLKLQATLSPNTESCPTPASA
jgi:hypothetical protein